MNIDKYKLWFIAIPASIETKICIESKIKNYKYIYENKEELFKNDRKFKKILEFYIDSDKIKKIEEGLLKKEFGIITYNEETYPKELKFIEDKPYALFYKGKIDKINKLDFIGIVGSRKPTNYGISVTKDIVSKLEGQEVGIVSGGALGIDTIAHMTAINKNLFNIAVLGCGIDIVYPKTNRELFKNIIKNGVIISEYLPGEQPMPYNFPYRNRLISGISKGVIIIEAAKKSGAVITTSYAVEQGKKVIAVPGNIYSPLSEGCNRLIMDGANIYENIEDIFYQFNINYVRKKHRKEKSNYLKVKILKLLEENPKHIEEIKKETNIDISMINELLFEMQFNNEIIGLTGNYFAKNIMNT
ncbi:DNA-processing protein DprA [Clostridium sp.]|uniref:DNA-processing protein DprA n=1 Tax=Clostridium sp. TaxID=1506 RepID=UPI0039913CD4